MQNPYCNGSDAVVVRERVSAVELELFGVTEHDSDLCVVLGRDSSKCEGILYQVNE
jgi:hypothetical protein